MAVREVDLLQVVHQYFHRQEPEFPMEQPAVAEPAPLGFGFELDREQGLEQPALQLELQEQFEH
jgi:hypothetical protein